MGRPSVGGGERVQNVRIQLNFGGEGAAQGNVPVNGQVTRTRGIFATRVANNGFILAGANGEQPSTVVCEAFGDEAGRNKIGELRGTGEAVRFTRGNGDVPVGAFRCAEAS